MKIVPPLFAVLVLLSVPPARGAFFITATRTELVFHFDKSGENRAMVELAPWQQPSDASPLSDLVADATSKTFSIPRFDGDRDRLYSAFVALSNGTPESSLRFVEADGGISQHRDSYPHARSKKGLQVQIVPDAIALGVQHAAFNIDIGACVRLKPAPDDYEWKLDGRSFWFNRNYIDAIDREVKPMSDSGALVTLILLNYSHPGTDANRILQHPDYDTNCPGHISEFNTSTPEGLEWYKAWVEFLAHRYSAPGSPFGRVVNYIVGNEVNAHWDWANMGKVPMEKFARDYERAVRMCALAVRKESRCGRVFISLEHDWNKLFAEPDSLRGFPGRSFIDYFNLIATAHGNFDWNLAFHPYPEDLFNCCTWKDQTALPSEFSPRITFKNIEMLARYFRRRELLYHGSPRHIILSEQGFHAKPTPGGECQQAAAYCYAWRKIVHLKGIDAFILHRQVDNRGEGGLNLGLWRRHVDSVCEPSSKRPIYTVFKYADTPEWRQSFAFALPIIGIKSWNEINAR